MGLLRGRKHRTVALLLCALIPLVLLTSMVLSGNGYEVDRWTVSGGASTSSGGAYVLNGVAGQPDAGEMKGGDYVLDGGLEPGDREPEITVIYLPLISNGEGS
jgi:hypothetical protein